MSNVTTNPRNAAMIAHYQSHDGPLTETAEQFCVSVQTLRNALATAGVPIRKYPRKEDEGAYEPTPEEIKAKCRELRANRETKPAPYVVPVIKVSDLVLERATNE